MVPYLTRMDGILTFSLWRKISDAKKPLSFEEFQKLPGLVPDMEYMGFDGELLLEGLRNGTILSLPKYIPGKTSFPGGTNTDDTYVEIRRNVWIYDTVAGAYETGVDTKQRISL